jgi:site-specific DNA recombinase
VADGTVGSPSSQRIDRLGRLIDKAYEDKLEGRVDEAFFNEKRVEWEEGRIEAAREVERLTRASAASLDAGIRVFELANSAHDQLSEREPLEQRDLLKFLFSNLTITEGALSVIWREPFNLLALSPDPENGNGADSDEQNRRRSEWSGWLYAYRTFWVDPGPDWDAEKVAAFIHIGARAK